mgnify:CR=1 FL=1
MNEEVLKNFARLQLKDEEGGIRTNTTVCLGKIASYLHPDTRQNVLISAFLRSMKDPFTPSRIAGILALSATESYYGPKECATRVMPALCHLCMDTEKEVRDHAFKALKGFVNKLEKVSDEMNKGKEKEQKKEANTTTPPPATPPPATPTSPTSPIAPAPKPIETETTKTTKTSTTTTTTNSWTRKGPMKLHAEKIA